MKNLLRLEALALLAVGLFAAASPEAANEPMTLRLAQSTPMLWPQTRIADGAGLWAKQGLTVKSTLFQCFNESVVSEQLARMVAMKSATDAAKKMGKSLKREFNRARQAAITTELSEIIGGAAALE